LTSAEVSLPSNLAGVTAPGYNCAFNMTMKSQSSILASPGTPTLPRDPTGSRFLSAFELCLGVFIVIGHNIFHIVPNEVIILSTLGLISIRLRDGSWSAMGIKRPASWRRVLLIALAAAAVRILLGQFLIEPVTGFFWPKPVAPALANEITGNVKIACLLCYICRIRRRDRIPWISPDARSRYWKAINNGLLDRDCARFDFIWLWALLQRRVWCH